MSNNPGSPEEAPQFAKILLRYRRPVIIAFHLALTAVSNYLAFWLRFDGQIPAEHLRVFSSTLPILVAIRGITFVPFRLYRGLWRYSGIWDLRNIIAAVFFSTFVFAVTVWTILDVPVYPRSVFLVDTLLLIMFLGGTRLIRRIYRELGRLERNKRMLVYGAGDAGEMIVRDMKNNPFYEYEPIGFVDDDPLKVGQRIHGLPVFGTHERMAEIISREKPSAVLVAMPRVTPSNVREIVKALEPFKIPIKTLPNLRDLMDGRLSVNQIRNLSIEDLLDRAPVGLNLDPVRSLIRGRRVLVTGAGGSIGSELCQQIASLEPAELTLYERYENGLYQVSSSLESAHCGVHSAIGDITDRERLDAVLGLYRPHLIFHAAAHKHVPLMELNPCEAVKNNVSGTRLVAEAALQHGVERFILISTDKAVNPSSIMGVTKKVAEMIVRSMDLGCPAVFVTVRFGNVLGSNGSVLPRFMEQINSGGPVTVTHSEMRRYFMLIPEAVQLVLHAAALATRNDVYVLEMGEQIKVVDFARNLIRLCGFVPDEDVEIVFTGIRAGEKLFEELVGEDEVIDSSPLEKISRVRACSQIDGILLRRQVADLEKSASAGDSAAVIRKLGVLVPSFSIVNQRPSPAGYAQAGD